jgi:AcrR family transcriptional regulator
MVLKASAHKQERALSTRRQLVAAARAIFVQEGFESARIEQIAAKAGKTRGAFYDNFTGKEDVFFAIFEEDIMRNREKVNAALSAASSSEEKIDTLARHLSKFIDDRPRILLNLEFKMYVIRHPRKRKRLNELYSEMCVRCSMEKISSLLPDLTDADLPKRHMITTELGAAIDGIALNSLFNPESISEERRTELLKLVAREALRAAKSALRENSRIFRRTKVRTQIPRGRPDKD